MADLESGSNRSKLDSKTEILEIREVTELAPSPERWTAKLCRILGVETQGIERVGVDSRQSAGPDDYTRIFLLWLNSSLTANNILVGLYGPSRYGLDLATASVIGVFGCVLGSIGVAYMSTWGPRSGHRTLVVTRYFLGYYPSKICCFLNILTMLGYGMVNCILGGQIIFTISNGRTAVPVGIVVVAVLTWCIATFGMNLFHLYSRYAWILALSVLCIMLGCAGPSFNPAAHLAPDLPADTPAHRLSFFSLCFASAISWTPSSADYFVYFPASTRTTRMFLAATAGISIAMVLTTTLGIGLATALYTNPAWMAASQGGLLALSFAGLRGFGSLCAALLLLTAVSNNIPATYTAGLNLQMLGKLGPRLPRPLLTSLEVLAYTVAAVVARDYLQDIMEDFLPLMSYWIVAWFAIVLEELLLRVYRAKRAYDWDAWDDAARLPGGWAAGASLAAGCLGAILGMDQSFYTGPVARYLDGADLGMWLAFIFAVVVYPPLRIVEIRFLGR
ncbi:putative purine-cytosine permease [Aspergillus clavatus NRRL 1]|uniref:Purine-cytosine permease, putative n=1 Tax=Aspergillus clavatus (strain ATCC 1007 / CBS 513.65 / DSM 816 / NCTC 3887 / NRRL 1 / QM 1276 / 107) TaxID=344612 RepID=A1CT14_ASPCL|nr:purine-cytosine permease, putative [Aspergillus clavatus NRRL 1]EAW06451.1 purine-cytosine permease, putative [Aspergillus clavatus NRRL 1]